MNNFFVSLTMINTYQNDNQPLVSVLMPTYNSIRYIQCAIESTLNQTYPNFEFIIIDDGSVDGTLEKINEYNDSRIKCIENSHRLGLAKSLNLGISYANGKYIARMDADDISLPDRFEKQVTYLEMHPTIGVLAGQISIIDQHNAPCGLWDADQSIVTEKQIYHRLPRENCIAHPTVMIRREILMQYPYDTIESAEDYELWLRLLNNGIKIAKLPEIVLNYRYHSNSVTMQSEREKSDSMKDSNVRTVFIHKSIKNKEITLFLLKVLVIEVTLRFFHKILRE